MNILIIEDDSTLNRNISDALRAEGLNVESVFNGLLAERMLRTTHYDCVIMDINLPDRTGFELCSNFREFNTATPVLMLTAFSELDDKIKGFDCGADDYLTKPFFMRELMLRVNSLLKRNRSSRNNNDHRSLIMAGDITIDQAQKKVTRQGTEVLLTPREYQILLKLCMNKGEIVSKNDLLTEIWGRSVDAITNTIEVYISFLRGKLDRPFGKNSIRTKVGYGYFLDTE